MKDKNFFVTAALITAVILIGGSVYFYRAKPAEFRPQGTFQETPEIKTEESDEEPDKETILTKDDFDLTLPAGWTEIMPPAESILVMAVIDDEKVTAAGFRTNLSIKQDDLTKYEQKYSLPDYVDSVKTSLIQAIPGIKFVKEEQGRVDGFDAIFVECESTQEEIDFATLLVFIEDENNQLWAISFNTLQDSWPAYQDVFYQIADSFNLSDNEL